MMGGKLQHQGSLEPSSLVACQGNQIGKINHVIKQIMEEPVVAGTQFQLSVLIEFPTCHVNNN